MVTRVMLIACVVLASSVISLHSEETRVLSGVVRDARTNAPLGNVSVMIKGTHRGDVTNYDGQFTITGVPMGTWVVRASLLGYVATEVTARVADDLATIIDLKLKEDEAIRVEEIVVSATRAHVYPQIDMDAEEVANRAPKDVGDFLRTVPGASSIRRAGTAMDPVVRGFRQDQINVQVDGGMKVWGACPNRMDPPTSHVQAEELDKIEIIKGPFSVRFGPTFGAVVNLVTEKPEQFETGAIHSLAEGGYESNWDGKRVHGTVTAGAPVADVYLSGGMKDYSNYDGGDGTEVESAFRMRDYSLKVGLNPEQRQRLQFTNRGSYMRDVHYPALPMDAFVDDTHMFAIDYASKWTGSRLSSLTAKGYGATVHHIMGNDWKSTYNMLHSKADLRAQTYGGKAEATLSPAKALLLYVGIDGYDHMKSGDRLREYVAGPNKGKTFLDTVWQDSHIRDIAGYFESRAFLTEKATAIAGIRLDNVRVTSDKPNAYFKSTFRGFLDVTEDNISAVAALLYTLTPYVDMRCGIGRGVRTADITERFVYIQPIGMDRYDYIGDPSLKPERNTQVELASSARIGETRLHVSLYYSFLRQYISAQVDSTVKPLSPDVLGVKRYVNVSDARMTGFELTSSTPIPGDLRVELSAAYSYGQNRDIREPLAEMPPLTGVALLHYQQQDRPVWAEFEGRFVARQSRVSASFQENVTPGFAVYSLRGGIQFLDHLDCAIALTNIFNKRYYEHLNRKSKADGRPILEPGRVFNIAVRLLY
jgi:iron complex outermembrane receptor protein